MHILLFLSYHIPIFALKYALYYIMNIEKKIKDRRMVLNITQQELSEISGISLRTIIKIENGKGNPSLETLSQIADVLGMEVTLQIKKIGDR